MSVYQVTNRGPANKAEEKQRKEKKNKVKKRKSKLYIQIIGPIVYLLMLFLFGQSVAVLCCCYPDTLQ